MITRLYNYIVSSSEGPSLLNRRSIFLSWIRFIFYSNCSIIDLKSIIIFWSFLLVCLLVVLIFTEFYIGILIISINFIIYIIYIL